MTESRTIPVSTVITCVLWALVVVLVAAAWICTAVGQHQVALMLGLTACASSAIAATASIRCFVLRTQRLIRTVFGLDATDDPASRTEPTPLRTL